MNDHFKSLFAKLTSNAKLIVELQQEIQQKEQEFSQKEQDIYHQIIQQIDLLEQEENACVEPFFQILQNFKVAQLQSPVNIMPEYAKVTAHIPSNQLAKGKSYKIIKNGYVQGTNVLRKTEIHCLKSWRAISQ